VSVCVGISIVIVHNCYSPASSSSLFCKSLSRGWMAREGRALLKGARYSMLEVCCWLRRFTAGTDGNL